MMGRPAVASCFRATLALTILTPGAAAASEPLSAEGIVRRMQETYASCTSYRDVGRVESLSHETPVLRFETAFERPRKLRFAFVAPWPGGVSGRVYEMVSDGARTVTWMQRAGSKQFPSLELGIASATGISNTAAARLPALLMTDLNWGSGLRQLEDTEHLGHDLVDGNTCHRILARTYASGCEHTLWVDARSFTIRRLETHCHGKGLHQRITFEPELNPRLEPEEFALHAAAESPPEKRELPRQPWTCARRAPAPRSRGHTERAVPPPAAIATRPGIFHGLDLIGTRARPAAGRLRMG